MFTQLEGFLFLGIFWIVACLGITLWTRRIKITASQFLVSNRDVGFVLGAVSAATAWIWAPALFVASQKAYQQGIPGLFWFTFPNALALIVFSFLAVRMRKIFDKGYTLPEFIGKRFGKTTQIIYLVTIFVVQIYAVIVQITAALLMLNLLSGIQKSILVIALGFIILSLSLLRGIRSSLMTDIIKATMITVVGVFLIPWVINESGGILALTHGFGGVSGKFTDLFNSNVAWTFGVPISVSLLSGVVIDQQQWQRAFAMRVSIVRKSFLLGGILFTIVPVLLGLLGFVAVQSKLNIPVAQSQLAGFYAVAHFLPPIGVLVFAFMILAGLIAAGSAALAAASSVGAIDLYRLLKPVITDKEVVVVSRITMVVITVAGVLIALIPNIEILYMQLLVGAFRASLMVPTILALFWTRLSSKFTLIGILLGMAVGLPLFVYGSIAKLPNISSFGSLIPIIITLLICIIGAIKDPGSFNYANLAKLSKKHKGF